jgi:hypothetical protein
LYADRFAFYTDEVRHASNTADQLPDGLPVTASS